MILLLLSLNFCMFFTLKAKKKKRTNNKNNVKGQSMQDTWSHKKSQLEESSTTEPLIKHKKLTQIYRSNDHCKDQAINQLVQCSLSVLTHLRVLISIDFLC